MSSEEIAAFAARELIALAEQWDRIAIMHGESEGPFLAGVRVTLRNCAHEARLRAAGLGGSGEHPS